VRVEGGDDALESARVRAMWGRFLVRRGLYAAAERVLDEALRIAPDHALALEVRGELALRTGDPAHARTLFEAAFVSSHQTRYLIDQSRAAELAGDRAGADRLRAQVESIVRDDIAAGGYGHRLELVEVMVDGGDPAKRAEAVALAREDVARRPSADSRFQLARALAADGQRDEAVDQMQAVLASGAREAQFYELAAWLESRATNPTRAAMYARLADELDPSGPDASAWRRMGLVR
jgi:tetratricopeptide (TPR) repeat protein